jgi:stage II sporulation protein D
LGFFVTAQQMRIGVLRDYQVKRILFAYNDGSYSILADTTDFGAILPNEFVDVIYKANHQIELKKGVISLGVFKKIILQETKAGFSIALSCKEPIVKERKYQNDFEITANSTGLTIVNLVDMNQYLSGVVESEGGGGKELEYYKVQALMSRTYALKYIRKHETEGFSLCDRVHCQAYHSMLRFTPSIADAVLATEGMVMEDASNQLVDAYFHANCGGQTSEAEYVWNEPVPYLNSFKDTFCIYTKQATWEKRISQQEWADYLVSHYNYPLNDSVYGPLIFTFNQPDRMAFYHKPALGIPLRDLREAFNLKSTFFSTYPEGMDVVIRGRGFGHGVGLCQEGAMRMAKYGYNFQQIAVYYFPGVHIVKLEQESFFKQKFVFPE